MICKNCGTDNSDNAKFCAYCASPLTTSSEPKKPQNRNKKNNNNKIIGIVLAFVSLILIILGGYFVLNGKIFKNEISVDAVTLDGDYEMDGDRYVLFTNENVVVIPNVKSSDSSYELKYEIEDTTAANIEQLGDKCTVIGLKETDANLNIYSDDKILKVVKLSFKDKDDDNTEEEKSKDDQQIENKGKNLDELSKNDEEKTKQKEKVKTQVEQDLVTCKYCGKKVNRSYTDKYNGCCSEYCLTMYEGNQYEQWEKQQDEHYFHEHCRSCGECLEDDTYGDLCESCYLKACEDRTRAKESREN